MWHEEYGKMQGQDILMYTKKYKRLFYPYTMCKEGKRKKKKNRGDSINLFEIAKYSKCVKLSERWHIPQLNWIWVKNRKS